MKTLKTAFLAIMVGLVTLWPVARSLATGHAVAAPGYVQTLPRLPH